jgi:uncharacterized membrane protein YjjB (DUF3815 family)
MAEQPNPGSTVWNRQLFVAFTAAVAFGVGFYVILKWGPLPAVIGGASMGVIWWSVDRAFKRPG